MQTSRDLAVGSSLGGVAVVSSLEAGVEQEAIMSAHPSELVRRKTASGRDGRVGPAPNFDNMSLTPKGVGGAGELLGRRREVSRSLRLEAAGLGVVGGELLARLRVGRALAPIVDDGPAEEEGAQDEEEEDGQGRRGDPAHASFLETGAPFASTYTRGRTVPPVAGQRVATSRERSSMA